MKDVIKNIKMFYLVVIIALIAVISASPAYKYEGRIVNGTDAYPGEIPYIVSLRLSIGHRCGASILNENHVLTAAHCVYQIATNQMNIQYGQLKVTTDHTSAIPVDTVIIHPQYKPSDGYPNDIAVIKLQSNISFSENVQPVKLPSVFETIPAGANAVLAGWGSLHSAGPSPTQLQRVNIIVYSDDECERIHQLTGPTNRNYHICAGIPEGGKGQCGGDSGGPLVANNEQIGIVSWSVKPCTIKGYPGVFTKVANYVNWINEQIKK